MNDATAWVTGSCADVALVVTSPPQQVHDRPWSTAAAYDICEADGSPGRVWFKANGVGTRHEPGLISVLGSLVPDLVPSVLAVDTDRAWSLTRDAGPTWRSAVPVADQWPLWEDLLQRYAAAQLVLAAHHPQLLATGMAARSPATLPGLVAELVAELSLLDADSGGLSVPDSRALRARLPAYGQWCLELDGSGIPLTIQHDDLHSNNICVTRSAAGRDAADRSAWGRETRRSAGSRVIDWGDASLGHPFGTMLTTLGSIAHHYGCEVDDPQVRRVRDAYLEPFTTYAPRSALVTLLGFALRVGVVTRALSWRAAMIGSPPVVHREYDFPVRGWLQELLAV